MTMFVWWFAHVTDSLIVSCFACLTCLRGVFVGESYVFPYAVDDIFQVMFCTIV